MSQASSNSQDEQDWSGERTITEFFPAMSESGALYRLAGKIPFGFGLLLYAPAYVLKVLNPFSVLRYTLTDRRIRVDKGTRKQTIRYVRLEDVEQIRQTNYSKFTRTGDLEIINRGEVILRLGGVQDPEPIRHTILDAVQSRIQVAQALDQERNNRALAAAT